MGVFLVLRSYLFVPGNKEKIINKAILSDADAVIIDFEDAVANDEKINARKLLRLVVKSFNIQKKELIVRINGIDTEHWKSDLDAVIKSEIKCIMLPKSESSKDINQIAQLVENNHIKDFSIIPLIESAKGVLNSYEIANSHPFVTRLAFGSVDYSLSIGAELSKEETELLFARSQLINSSSAAGIQSPLDCPYLDFDDEKGFIDSVKRAKKLGMQSKLLIHPKQIALLHNVYVLSDEEVENSMGIVQAFEEALVNGIAAISYKGKMIDYPIYKQAKDIISKYYKTKVER